MAYESIKWNKEKVNELQKAWGKFRKQLKRKQKRKIEKVLTGHTRKEMKQYRESKKVSGSYKEKQQEEYEKNKRIRELKLNEKT